MVDNDDFFEKAINFVNDKDSIVGTSENIMQVFDVLKLNFKNTLPKPSHLKVSPLTDKKSLVIDDEIIEHVHKINYFDYKLYNYVKNL